MINYNQILCDVKGNALLTGTGEPMTLREAVIGAIEGNMESLKNASQTDKKKRFHAMLALASGKSDEDFQDRETIDDLKSWTAGAYFSPTIEGRMSEALSGADEVTPKNLHLFSHQ